MQGKLALGIGCNPYTLRCPVPVPVPVLIVRHILVNLPELFTFSSYHTLRFPSTFIVVRFSIVEEADT
jgi:hypothetical protein